MKCKRKSHAGATLAELLVVVSIFLIFITLLAPAIRKQVEAANTGQCLNNLRQIGLAFQAYARDYGDCLPDSRLAGRNGDPIPYPPQPGSSSYTMDWRMCVQNAQGQRCAWSYALRNYLENTAVFYCPSDASPQPLKNYTGAYQMRFVMTNYMPGTIVPAVKFSMAKRPSRLVYIFETNNWHRNFGYPYIGYPLHPQYGYMGKGKDVGTQYCNAMFMDGHVAAWPVPAQRYTNAGYAGYQRPWFYGDVLADDGGPNTGSNTGIQSLIDYDGNQCDPYDVK